MSPCHLYFTVLVFLCFHQGQSMQFLVTPRKGTESLTDQVTFSCRTDINAPSRPTEIFFIQITRGDYESVVVLRSNGKISYRDEKSSKLEATGEISNLGIMGGYLNVTMHYPKHEDTGIYKCHVVCLDDKGVTRHYTNESYLDVDKQSYSKLDARVRSLEVILQRNVRTNSTSFMKTETVHAFSAAVTGERVFNVGDVVVFNDVITRQGQGYDPNTGIFTAPVDGVYALFLVIGMEMKETVNAGFSLQSAEDREFVRLFVGDEDKGDHSSVSSVVVLKSGEKVKVVVVFKTDGEAYIYPNKYSTFSGFLIRET